MMSAETSLLSGIKVGHVQLVECERCDSVTIGEGKRQSDTETKVYGTHPEQREDALELAPRPSGMRDCCTIPCAPTCAPDQGKEKECYKGACVVSSGQCCSTVGMLTATLGSAKVCCSPQAAAATYGIGWITAYCGVALAMAGIYRISESGFFRERGSV